jgi:DNA-binding transcriptional MerR regulator
MVMTSAQSMEVSVGARVGKRWGETTIREMAREYDVSLRTLRFYEDRGLLTPRRQGSGRYYDEEDRRRLEAILEGKKLGFTLVEIRDFIGDGQGDTNFEQMLGVQQILDQIHHLERQRDEIEATIGRLRAMESRRQHSLAAP